MALKEVSNAEGEPLIDMRWFRIGAVLTATAFIIGNISLFNIGIVAMSGAWASQQK